MAEALQIPETNDRAALYAAVIPQVESVLEGESDLVANLANIAAILREVFGFFWVGFYRAEGDELILGPFQGPLACTRIAKGKGVCGTCFERMESILVPDVEKFPGHIACSSESRSEVVVPVIVDGGVRLVLDVDSDTLDDFSELDRAALEQLCELIASRCF